MPIYRTNPPLRPGIYLGIASSKKLNDAAINSALASYGHRNVRAADIVAITDKLHELYPGSDMSRDKLSDAQAHYIAWKALGSASIEFGIAQVRPGIGVGININNDNMTISTGVTQ